MKYYTEDRMKAIRSKFEQQVLQWPSVTAKRMFGCPCYQANKKLFAFLVKGGVVVTKLLQDDLERVPKEFKARTFRAGNKQVRSWIMLPIKSKAELDRIMPLVRRSYESAP